jgi:hypothetical protein
MFLWLASFYAVAGTGMLAAFLRSAKTFKKFQIPDPGSEFFFAKNGEGVQKMVTFARIGILCVIFPFLLKFFSFPVLDVFLQKILFIYHMIYYLLNVHRQQRRCEKFITKFIAI